MGRLESIAPKIGCVASTLLDWVKQAEVDAGSRAGVTTSEAQRVRELEREVKELRRANEILKSASAFLSKLRIRLFSPRRNSTADSRAESVCRGTSTNLRGRADLQAAADRPVRLQAPCGTPA
jgi:transposase-like protein